MNESTEQNAGKHRLSLGAAFTALLIGAAAMGASPIFVRFAASDVGPFASAFWRVFLALPFLYVWMRVETTRLPASERRGGLFSLFPMLAGLAFVGDLFFWHLSILNTTVANATFFATLAPVFVIGITWLVLRKDVQRKALLGVALCLCGGGVLVGKTMNVNPESLTGDVYGVCTALFFALYFLAISRARQSGQSSSRVIFGQTTVTAAGLLIIAAVHSAVSGVGFFPTSGRGLAALVSLALVSQVGGQGLLTVSMGRLPAVFSSLVIFLEALVAALLGWLFLDEGISSLQVVGGILILAGIWIARPKSAAEAGGTAADKEPKASQQSSRRGMRIYHNHPIEKRIES